MKIINIWKHFCTITKHRHLVRKHCFRLGLYWQGLTHDLSKYSPEEFWTGVRYYQGTRSPNAALRGEDIGFSKAWLHHKGRNKHHYEYWIDISSNKEDGLVGNKMPLRYVAEMICDRIAACEVYRGRNYTSAAPGSTMNLQRNISPSTLRPGSFWRSCSLCSGMKGRRRPMCI